VIVVEGLYRVRDGEAGARLAVGPVDRGPDRLLPPHLTVADVLRDGGDGLAAAVSSGAAEPAPRGTAFAILAPVDRQEVWAAGVTYRRSRDARKDESTVADVYDRVYVADRTELFFKSAGWRVSGPGDAVGVRADSTWDVPEPELGVVVAAGGSIAGWVIGNDMSSRSIEGENPLYLPQAKVYEGSCALGPCLVARDAVAFPAGIHLRIERDGAAAFEGSTSTAEIVRSFEDLVEALVRALPFPDGAILLTGTGVVPGADFTLRPGDIVEIRIDGLGTLRNPVIEVG
jgi:2-dehydro-3-deoxy-D-arabinonate dehydratase